MNDKVKIKVPEYGNFNSGIHVYKKNKDIESKIEIKNVNIQNLPILSSGIMFIIDELNIIEKVKQTFDKNKIALDSDGSNSKSLDNVKQIIKLFIITNNWRIKFEQSLFEDEKAMTFLLKQL